MNFFFACTLPLCSMMTNVVFSMKTVFVRIHLPFRPSFHLFFFGVKTPLFLATQNTSKPPLLSFFIRALANFI